MGPPDREQDHEVVLAEIGELTDAQPGSPDGDRLDVMELHSTQANEIGKIERLRA